MGHFGRVCRGAEKKIHGMGKDSYSSEETDSSDDEYQQAKNLHLLHLKSLRIHEVGNENDMPRDNEWWETVQLQNVAPDARIKKTHKRLVSYSQHQIVPSGCTTLKVKHKEKEIKVKFFIIDKAHNPILSGKVCKALNLVKRIHEIDHNLKELLIQHPDLENATGSIPGTYSIKIDPTVTPVVHGPRR
ncbi:Hypothetical predicted protein [Paramuricea clavata]|uniref:Uncharacterized protein n=1 Tax=Paramuricea clavata TaxID=317549 RepID=A0A7D9LDR9_PARCT|nr:Hypothetical predicted protein [Paramuricea clavata]